LLLLHFAKQFSNNGVLCFQGLDFAIQFFPDFCAEAEPTNTVTEIHINAIRSLMCAENLRM